MFCTLKEFSEMESGSSSSMSAYDSDVKDVEIELRKESTCHNKTHPRIVVRSEQEDLKISR